MPADYVRCQFVDDAGLECDKWFESAGGGVSNKFCPAHANGAMSVDNALKDDSAKSAYITLVNETRVLVAAMTLDQIDEHIAGIEAVIEAERTKLLTSRAVKSEKLDELTEDERKTRRATKIPKTDKPVKAPTTKATTMAKDPVAYLMEKHGLSREQAMSMLGKV